MRVCEEEIKRIVHCYPTERRFVLAAMQDMQRAFSFVPKEGMKFLAEYLSCPMSELYSLVTFYKALSLLPGGKHTIKLCDGTACHIRGSMNLKTYMCGLLDIEPGEVTADGLFSLEIVNCLGACASGPVIMIDEEIFGNVTADSISDILDSYRRKEQ